MLLIARTLAGLIGAASLFNLAGGLLHPGFDATLWWLDLRALPRPVAIALLALSSLLLIWYALNPVLESMRKFSTAAAVGALLAFALFNTVTCLCLAAHESIQLDSPIPFSACVALSLAVVLGAVLFLKPDRASFAYLPALALAGLLLLCVPLAQMYCFGQTDYRRHADAAIVFGARVYADGRPSQALADRTLTAIELYRAGYVKALIFSGGPGDGEFHETDTMKRLALERGVPESAIYIDRQGLNTRATVANTTAILDKIGAQHVLAVSHAYHLPRVKLCYQRAGWDVCTVPATEYYPIAGKPLFIAREVAALWSYYVCP